MANKSKESVLTNPIEKYDYSFSVAERKMMDELAYYKDSHQKSKLTDKVKSKITDLSSQFRVNLDMDTGYYFLANRKPDLEVYDAYMILLMNSGVEDEFIPTIDVLKDRWLNNLNFNDSNILTNQDKKKLKCLLNLDYDNEDIRYKFISDDKMIANIKSKVTSYMASNASAKDKAYVKGLYNSFMNKVFGKVSLGKKGPKETSDFLEYGDGLDGIYKGVIHDGIKRLKDPKFDLNSTWESLKGSLDLYAKHKKVGFSILYRELGLEQFLMVALISGMNKVISTKSLSDSEKKGFDSVIKELRRYTTDKNVLQSISEIEGGINEFYVLFQEVKKVELATLNRLKASYNRINTKLESIYSSILFLNSNFNDFVTDIKGLDGDLSFEKRRMLISQRFQLMSSAKEFGSSMEIVPNILQLTTDVNKFVKTYIESGLVSDDMTFASERFINFHQNTDDIVELSDFISFIQIYSSPVSDFDHISAALRVLVKDKYKNDYKNRLIYLSNNIGIPYDDLEYLYKGKFDYYKDKALGMIPKPNNPNS